MNELLKKYNKQIIIVLGIIVILICLIFNNKGEVHASNDEIINEKVLENVTIETSVETLKVDIKGEVNYPGVYELEVGKRIIDVIEKSGGLTNNANTMNINLSKKLQDEMVILVPNVNTVTEDMIINESNLININTASQEELLGLTGIGESKAKDIIEYRNQQQFIKIEDIMNISGIGNSIFEKIKDEITV